MLIFLTYFFKELFATKRSRPDIYTAVAFITTLIRAPDEYNWKNLAHMMRCPRGTPEIMLTLLSDRTNTFLWPVYEAHLVHPKFRGHMKKEGTYEKD